MRDDEVISPEKLAKFQYGIMAYILLEDGSALVDIVHCCLYENPIRSVDIEELEKELNTDPDFGLVGEINKSVFLAEAPKEVIQHYRDGISP